MKQVKPAKKQSPDVIVGTAGMSKAERAEYAAHIQNTLSALVPLNPAARRMGERIALCLWRIHQFETLETSDFAVSSPGLEAWSRYWKRNLKVAERAFRALQSGRFKKNPGRTPRNPTSIARAA